MPVIDTPQGQRMKHRDGRITMLDGSPCADPFAPPAKAGTAAEPAPADPTPAFDAKELAELQTYRDATVLEMADLKGQVLERDTTIAKLNEALKAAQAPIADRAAMIENLRGNLTVALSRDGAMTEPSSAVAATPADTGAGTAEQQ